MLIYSQITQEDVRIIFDFYNYDCDTIVHHYNVCFAALLDKYAPVKSINVPNGDPNPV